jgi:hypothetical protein
MGRCDDWRAAQDSTRGQWVETRTKKCAEEKDQGYNKCTKEEDQGYNKCTEEKDQGYNKCTEEKDQGHNECCTWWPCSWACNALVWVSNIVCVAWTWVKNVVCVAWTWVKNMVCVLWTWIKNVVCVAWTWTVDKAWRAKSWVGTATCKVAEFVGRFAGFVGRFAGGVAAWVERHFGERPQPGTGPCAPGPWEPKSALAFAVDAAGFWYDPRQDIIYSRMNPVQRNFGYAYGYDAAALAMNAIIDCEPIFFDYASKMWMIELWKGQYGLETGCEIGVYNRAPDSPAHYALLDAAIGTRPGDSTPSHNLFFDSASDSELLTMSFTLHRNDEKILCRGPERHWWLTGFKWGVLSEPSDLTMDVSITCLDAEMTSAFLSALTAMGYTDVRRDGNTVDFTFDIPKTRQPRDDYPPVVVAGVRAANQQNVAAYNSLGLTSNDPNTVIGVAIAAIGRAFVI